MPQAESRLYFLITIAERARLPEFISLYEKRGISANIVILGQGTASGALLNAFGLDSSAKAVCFSHVTSESWRRLKRDLRQQLRIDVPGVGVAFVIPVSSIGGKRQLAFVLDGQDFSVGEESSLKGTKYELLVVISSSGFNEMVMDAARQAGATGGTVVHARGTGPDQGKRFFGISLAPEKEVTFIVSRTELKNAIMRSIMEKAGTQTKAQSIVFSLPVTDTAGLRLLEEEPENPVQTPPQTPQTPPQSGDTPKSPSDTVPDTASDA